MSEPEKPRVAIVRRIGGEPLMTVPIDSEIGAITPSMFHPYYNILTGSHSVMVRRPHRRRRNKKK